MLAGGDNSAVALTMDRPNLELSTEVKVSGSEEMAPKDDPSPMSPFIESLKACQSSWRGASDKAKHCKAVVA